MALIRSLIHRPHAPIELGTQRYFFRPIDGTPDGPHVCEVTDPAHIERLLSITEGYVPYELPTLTRAPSTPEPPVAPPSQPTTQVIAVGTATQPAPVDGVDQDRVIALRGLSVADLRAQLQQITEPKLLAALLALEESSTQPPPRSTVVSIVRARIAALAA